MATVARLVTLVDVDDPRAGARQMSFAARHEAVLEDGGRVLLFDDRGWSSAPLSPAPAGHDRDRGRRRPDDIWATTSVE